MTKPSAPSAAPSPAWFDFKQSLKPATVVWLGIAGAALFVGAWQWLGVSGQVPRQLFPPPTDVGAALWRLLSEANFAADIWASLVRIMVSFALAAAIAPQLAELAAAYTHVFGPSTTFGKDLMPRVAA